MNPSEYYKRLIASITELNERTVRVILNTLVTEYGVPVCAHSGKAGRWPAL